MSAITGYNEIMNYRGLSIGYNAEPEQEAAVALRRQPDTAADQSASGWQHDMETQPFIRQTGTRELPSIRGIMESIRQAGNRLTDDDLQDKLDDMVLKGDLTDDQADEIFAGLKRASTSAPLMRSLNGLAETGAISQQQRDAAAAALLGAGDKLQNLVDDGMLTQDQADAVLESCRGAAKLRQARQAYSLMQQNPLARAAESSQYGILDAYEDSLAEGAQA